MKLELLVIVNQTCHGEYVLTARHGMEGGSAGSPRSNIGVHSKITNWAKVVTRYPYENVRMDYLLIERFIYFSHS